MTRLKTEDLMPAMGNMQAYNEKMREILGVGIHGVAAHALGLEEKTVALALQASTVGIIPISSGEGLISGFSQLLFETASFLGCKTQILAQDQEGFAQAKRDNYEIILWSDDDSYWAENLPFAFHAENGWATGLGYAAALDLMISRCQYEKKVLVLGAGPVGRSAAYALCLAGYQVVLCDKEREKSVNYAKTLTNCMGVDLETIASCAPYSCMLDATPADTLYVEKYLTKNPCITAPCVPCPWVGRKEYAAKLWHDPLQLGTAIMLASAVTRTTNLAH